MSPRHSAALVALSSVAVLGGTALAGSPARPTDRGCLLAWNASTNRGNQARLLAARPLAALSLLPATGYRVTWTSGSAAKQSTTEACLLTVAKRSSVRAVTGPWHGGCVARWTWGRPIPSTKPFVPNVRLGPNGRLATLYRP